MPNISLTTYPTLYLCPGASGASPSPRTLAKARVGCFARDGPAFAPDLPLRSALLLRAQECKPAAKVSREDSKTV